MGKEPIETLARAIHERWRVEQRRSGEAAPPDWAELDESRQNSSRDQAGDIVRKLQRIGCSVAPLSAMAPIDFRFTDEEVDLLGVEEHRRWVRERLANGWTPGPKDPARKTTPYLVSFSELPPDIAEYDRMYIREIPNLLAAAGLRVVRDAGER